MDPPIDNLTPQDEAFCKMQDGINQAHRQLLAACKMYCDWYDHGRPPIEGGAMAYELVTAIRHTLETIDPLR